MGNIDGPIAIAQPDVDFAELARIRDQVREIERNALPSLDNYRDPPSGGYFHLYKSDVKGKLNKPGDPSWASSATVVTYLIRTGQWPPDKPGQGADVASERLLTRFVLDEPWRSAELDEDNPFTLGFALELVLELRRSGATLTPQQESICEGKLELLKAHVSSGGGADVPGRVSCGDELPNSYLTDLATRVLEAWAQDKRFRKVATLDSDLRGQVRDQAANSINEQMALLRAERPGADPLRADVFELGYASILYAHFGADAITPERRTLVREALSAFFSAQRPDGSWPRSRRLFTYPRYGDAYCHDFEFLSRLLRAFYEDDNRKSLVPYIAGLGLAVGRLIAQAKALPGGGFGWASGHHRAFVYPESWSTAACYDVAQQIDRIVTDAITATVEDHLGQPTFGPQPAADQTKFEGLLDSHIKTAPSADPTLKAILKQHLLGPVLADQTRLEQGKKFQESTLLSAILYGPPGTSKTTYAKRISQYLGWPLLTVDPSHLLRSGFDNIHLEIARLFRMLEKVERVVVFFDEIDELVRDRSAASVGAVSRFLTTSMLPQILKLRESRRLVFLVATNHIETFDPAVARPGRFDLVLPVLPPTWQEKLREWPEVASAMKRVRLAKSKSHQQQLERLTYDEVKQISARLAAASDGNAFSEILTDAFDRCVLNTRVTQRKSDTWEQLIKQQESRIRYPV